MFIQYYAILFYLSCYRINTESYLNRCCDALLVSTQTFAFLPAHGLQHLIADIIAVQSVLCGLFVISAKSNGATCILILIMHLYCHSKHLTKHIVIK